MFTLDPSIPTTGTIPTGISLGSYGTIAATNSISLGIYEVPTSLLDTTGTATVPAYTGESFTVQVAPNISALREVRVGGRTYTQALNTELPEPGEFVYSPATGAVDIYPVASPLQGELIDYAGLAANYPVGTRIARTNTPVGAPDFLAQWNVDGGFTIDRNYGSHPSCSMKFTTSLRNEAAVKAALRNGTEVNLFGIGFRVASLNAVRRSPENFPQGLLDVNVSFQGKWEAFGNTSRSPLDRPRRTKRVAKTATKIPLSQLTAYGGVSYYGPPIYMKIPKDIDDNTTTTIRSEIDSRAIVGQGFAYWSNPFGVEVRVFGQTAFHFLSDADILSTEIGFNWPGHAAIMQNIQLTDEFNNCVLNLDSSNPEESQRDETVILIEGDPNPSEAPVFETETQEGQQTKKISLREPSAAFDSGGKTKYWKRTTYINGTVVLEEEKRWGLIFVAADVYAIEFQNGKTVARYAYPEFLGLHKFWKQVEDTTTTHNFSAFDGYLESVERKGWRKVRPKVEGSSMETLEIAKKLKEGASSGIDAAEKAKLDAELGIYQYPGKYVQPADPFAPSQTAFANSEDQRAIPLVVDDVTTYELEPFGTYYADSPKPNPYNSKEVVPKFAKRTVRTDNSYIVLPDPTSTEEEEKPPLSTGKKFQDIKEIEIVIPRSSAPGGPKTPEIFQENTVTANSEGPFLRRVLQISYFVQNQGRPGVQQRLERRSGGLPSSSTANSGYKYILTSFGSLAQPGDPEEGSVSYPDVSDPSLGRRCAETEISIKNSQAAETLTLQVKYNSAYCEGDLLSWNGYLYVIWGVNSTFRIEPGKVYCTSQSIKLGRYLRVPVTMRQVPIATTSSSPQQV